MAVDEAVGTSVLTERSTRVATAHRLLRKARRVESGEFLAEGAQAVTEAVGVERERPGTVRELFVTEAAGIRNRELVRAAFAVGIEVLQVTDKAAAALSDTVHPQGLVARCALAWTPLEDLLANDPKLVAVLVESADPGNTGTVIRLADAAGADAVIFAGDGVDPFNPKAVRASTGSLFHLPLVTAPDAQALLGRLSSAALSVLATAGTADVDLDTADDLLELPTAWLFGSEAHGLPDALLAAADERVRVPIYGRAESLNLAAAAALCLYASARAQRR